MNIQIFTKRFDVLLSSCYNCVDYFQSSPDSPFMSTIDFLYTLNKLYFFIKVIHVKKEQLGPPSFWDDKQQHILLN